MVRRMDRWPVKLDIRKRRGMWVLTWYGRRYIRENVYEYHPTVVELYRTWDAAVESANKQYPYMVYLEQLKETLQPRL